MTRPRAFVRAVAAVAMPGMAGLAGCGDDTDAPASITQAQYDSEAAQACEQHGWALARAYDAGAPYSDAEKIAFIESDFIPRARAIVRRMSTLGFPASEDERYRAAYQRVSEALDELGEHPWAYFQRRRDAGYEPGEQPIARTQRGFAEADVPC